MPYSVIPSDVSATFASADWFKANSIPWEPYHQLAGVLPRKRLNTQFLDTSNTWLVTSNLDTRPAYLQIPGAYATNCPRPAVHAAACAQRRSAAYGAPYYGGA